MASVHVPMMFLLNRALSQFYKTICLSIEYSKKNAFRVNTVNDSVVKYIRESTSCIFTRWDIEWRYLYDDVLR